MIKRGLVLILMLTLLCIGPIGCFGGRPALRQEETGSVTISISSLDARREALSQSTGHIQPYSGGTHPAEAEVMLTNGTTVLSQTVTLENGEAEVTFSNVVVGPWTVIVQLKDAEGNAAYEGLCRVAITSDRIA